MHQTDRVKLQFGIPQEIPQQPMDMRGYHQLSLKKVVDTSWELQWSDEIAIWDLRQERVLNNAMRFEVEVKPDYNYLSWFIATFTPFVSSNQQLQDPRVVELMPTTYPSPPSPPQQHTEAFHTPLHLSQPQYHTDTSNPYTYPQHYASSSSFQPSSSTFQPPPSTYQSFEFPPPPPPQQQQQHFGFPSSQVELGNFVENDFLEQLTVDADFSPNWYNSMSQLLNSDLTVQAQSSGQNSGFDLNTPVNEEEEEEPVPQLQQLRQLPHRNRQPRKCALCGTPGHIRSKCPNVSGSSTQH
ncbi:serine/threonine-protein phosphatase 7 long form protein [Trifolium repens]|nr:serine/threonine-protein phosphatase 7 long form protein [Trifolium repens]